MAKKQVVSYSYTCDVCGDEIPDSDADGASRKVSWDGADYVLDVCAKHGTALSDVLEQLKGFVDLSHRAGARRGRRPASAASTVATRSPRPRRAAAAAAGASSPKRSDLASIRSWAQANGHSVGDRGRIPAAIIAAYDASSNGDTPEPAPRTRRPRKAAATAAV